MLAQPGAIAGLTLTGERPHPRVIGDGLPLGLCGSGAISAISALRRVGVITSSGQLVPAAEVSSNLANYLQGTGKDGAFIIYRDARRTIALTQDDIRQVQLAIAAVRAGIEVLLTRADISATRQSPPVGSNAFSAPSD